MIHRTRFLLTAALLAVPAWALAQHAPQAAPPASDAPAVAPAPPAEPAPGDAMDDAGLWFDEDDALAFGLEDETFLDAPGDPGGEAGMGLSDAPDPSGERRVVVRRRLGGPRDPEALGAGMHRGYLSGRPMIHRAMPMLRARLAQLDLSDTQRQKLRDIREAQVRRGIQRRADMQLARMDLHRLLRAEPPNPSAVNAQIDRMARMHADAMKARFEARMQARAVLTPEQLKKLHAPMGGARMQHEMMDTPDGSPRR